MTFGFAVVITGFVLVLLAAALFFFRWLVDRIEDVQNRLAERRIARRR